MGPPNDERARKTLYVTGFNSKVTSKRLLEELFTQGGPVKDITMFDTHAYVLFHDEESVPYCLALFNEVELHGQKLRLNSRTKTKDTYSYMKYLMNVRKKLMSEYNKLPPPDLPPKQIKQTTKTGKSQRKRNKSGGRKGNHSTSTANNDIQSSGKSNNDDKKNGASTKSVAKQTNSRSRMRKHRPRPKKKLKRKI